MFEAPKLFDFETHIQFLSNIVLINFVIKLSVFIPFAVYRAGQ